MNATHPPDNVFQDAKNHVSLVKESFTRTWNDMQSALESFSMIIHRQALQIRSLETQAIGLQRTLDDKEALAESLETKITNLTQSFNTELEQKQALLAETVRRLTSLREAAQQGNTCIKELREDATAKETRYQHVLAQVEDLQQQLKETNRAKEGDGDESQRDVELESKMATFEGALKKELEARSQKVLQAAIAVAKEAAATNTALAKSYHESQARVVSLEQQLRISRGTVEKMTKTLQSAQSIPVTMPDRGSSGAATPPRIVSGTYRPKPPLSNKSNSTTPPVVSNISGEKSTPPVFTSPPNVPPPLSINTSAGPAQKSTREVIDLTFSPVDTPGSAQSTSWAQNDAPPAKRRRVEDDCRPHVSPRFDKMNLQKATQEISSGNAAMRAGYDVSQEPDQRHRVS